MGRVGEGLGVGGGLGRVGEGWGRFEGGLREGWEGWGGLRES